MRREENQLDVVNDFLHLQSARYVSGTYMPIIRSWRLYLCYYRMWCVMHWLLVVGCQEQSSRLCVRDEGTARAAYIIPDA